MYLFTRSKDDFSYIPEGILEGLGEIKFLRSSLPCRKETEKIACRYKEIENHVNGQGYYVLKME